MNQSTSMMAQSLTGNVKPYFHFSFLNTLVVIWRGRGEGRERGSKDQDPSLHCAPKPNSFVAKHNKSLTDFETKCNKSICYEVKSKTAKVF